MRLFTLSTGLALSVLLVGCAAPALDQRQVISWLDAKTEAPDLEVAGAWESVNGFMSGGWGNASLVQNGAKVTGTLGLYTVDGKIAGKKLYAMILSGNKVFYTVILEPTKDGALAGTAVAKVLADDPEARTAERAPIQLLRPKAK